jgi:hypothetical protein
MFPLTLDELIPEDHIGRVIEAFVDRPESPNIALFLLVAPFRNRLYHSGATGVNQWVLGTRPVKIMLSRDPYKVKLTVVSGYRGGRRSRTAVA